MLIDDVCSDVPNAFWHRKKHIVDLLYIKDFNENNIPTKARLIQMNAETVEFCKKEISDLLEKKLIRKPSPLDLVLLFMFKKMLRLKEEPPD